MEGYNKRLHLDASPKLYQFGRVLRKEQTRAEQILWGHLRNRKFYGFKFRRQHPLDEYIADFYCHEKQFVIELDGAVHNGKMNANYDAGRTNDLNKAGINVIRFENSQIENNIEEVLQTLREALEIFNV